MNLFLYIFVMAAVTYAIRVIPLVFVKKKIENRFIMSFLYYVPYAVLAAMTVPAIFYATSYVSSAAIGFVVACICAIKNKSLIFVASAGCIAVLIAELAIKYVV